MATINSNGTMVFGNPSGGSVTIAPINNTSANYTLTIPSVSGSVALVDSQALTGIPTAPTATVGTNNTQLATTAFVATANNLKQDTLGFTPIQQGTGIGQGTNTIKIGWSSGNKLKCTVDVTDQGTIWTDTYNGFNAIGTAPMYACRAWVNYNGVTPAIKASGNVSSVTKNATGDYTVNFTTAMPDVNYSVGLGSVMYTTSNNSVLTVIKGTSTALTAALKSTTAIGIASYNNVTTSTAGYDSTDVNVSIFR